MVYKCVKITGIHKTVKHNYISLINSLWKLETTIIWSDMNMKDTLLPQDKNTEPIISIHTQIMQVDHKITTMLPTIHVWWFFVQFSGQEVTANFILTCNHFDQIKVSIFFFLAEFLETFIFMIFSLKILKSMSQKWYIW